MQTVDISVRARQGKGKSVTRKLRQQDLIPAVLYGGGRDSRSIMVDRLTIERILRSQGTGNVLFNLKVDDDEPELTIVRDRQRHPVSGNLLHLDFLRISLDKPIHVEIPIHLQGESVGVKDFGGILEHLLRSIEVSCLPMEVPEEILLDVSELGINEALHIKDLQLEGVEVIGEPDRTVVMVAPPRILKTAVEAAAEEAEEAAAAAEGEAPAEGETAAEDKGDEGKA